MSERSGSLGVLALLGLPLLGLISRCDNVLPYLDDAARGGRVAIGAIDQAAARWGVDAAPHVDQAKHAVGAPYAELVGDVYCLHLQSLARTGQMPPEEQYVAFLREKAGGHYHRVRGSLEGLKDFLDALQKERDVKPLALALAADIGCQARSLGDLAP